MKANILFALGLGIVMSVASCKSWTEPKAQNIDKHLADADSALSLSYQRYLENLRAYKESDHQVTFGWFGGWSGEGPKSRFLYHLPDSTDFISIWGGWSNLTEAKYNDLKRAQKEKGLKALTCVLMFQIGDAITPPKPTDEEHKNLTWNGWQHKFWGWDDNDSASIDAAVIRYANALCDTIDKYGYDGFDLDAEPSYSQPFETNKELWKKENGRRPRIELLIKTMAKRIGPMAETEEGRRKLLVVDGEPAAFSTDMGKYFNYFIVQAYKCRSYADLDNRLSRLVNHFRGALTEEEVAAKFITTETFEELSNGGVQFTARDGKIYPSYIGMAHWQPLTGRKGGIGTYHMEKDFAETPPYKYLREGIQIMNPALIK